jgi:hypothetical protein
MIGHKRSGIKQPPIAITLALLTASTFCAGARAAPTSAPATTPAATTPATTQPRPQMVADLTSPKAAAKTLFTAIHNQDVDQLRAALDSTDEGQRQLTAALADVIIAGKRLADASHAKFGTAGGAIAKPMIATSDFKKIDNATVTEVSETATVTIEGQPRPMTFRKRDGSWRLVVEENGVATPEEFKQRLKLRTDMAAALRETALDLAAGKYATPQEAERYIQERLHAVMIGTFHLDRGAATQPATTRAAKLN